MQLAFNGTFAGTLLGQHLAKHITFVERQATQLVGKQGDLFLEDQETKCFLCDLMRIIIEVFDMVWAFLCVHVFIMHICRQGTRSIDGCDSRHINNITRLRSHTELLSALLCELEYPSPLTSMEDVFIYLFIV